MQDSKTGELVDICNKLCTALVSSNEYEVLTLCSAFQKDRQGVVFACDLLKNIFRDALLPKMKVNVFQGRKRVRHFLKHLFQGKI